MNEDIWLYGLPDLHFYFLHRPPKPPFGFSDGQISIFAEVPDFVVPREFISTVTLSGAFIAV